MALVMQSWVDNPLDYVGLIPSFLDEEDERPAAKQFDEKYSYGGGWRPMDEWKFVDQGCKIQYPDDPPYDPRVALKFRDEIIIVYDHGWVCIVQPDNSFEVSRMD